MNWTIQFLSSSWRSKASVQVLNLQIVQFMEIQSFSADSESAVVGCRQIGLQLERREAGSVTGSADSPIHELNCQIMRPTSP